MAKFGTTTATSNCDGISSRIGAREAAGLDGAHDNRSEHARCHVIRMAFEARRFVQNSRRLPAQIEQALRNNDARSERGGARSEPLTDRNVVIDVEVDRGQRQVRTRRDGHRGLPDQVVFS